MTKHRIEIYSANCALCEETIDLVNSIACSSCEIEVLNMQDQAVVSRAKEKGIQRLPAVVIDGKLAACCENKKVDADTLRTMLS